MSRTFFSKTEHQEELSTVTTSSQVHQEQCVYRDNMAASFQQHTLFCSHSNTSMHKYFQILQETRYTQKTLLIAQYISAEKNLRQFLINHCALKDSHPVSQSPPSLGNGYTLNRKTLQVTNLSTTRAIVLPYLLEMQTSGWKVQVRMDVRIVSSMKTKTFKA